MVLIYEGNDLEENFKLPNEYHIKIDYGVLDDGSFTGKKQFLPFSERYVGRYRRSQLLNNSGKIITEVIEDNPDYISEEKEEMLKENGFRYGDEYEKSVSFPNGMSAKIEYWMTPKSRNENFGRFDAKYRRSVLFDENGEIISEIMERNPSYDDGKTPVASPGEEFM